MEDTNNIVTLFAGMMIGATIAVVLIVLSQPKGDEYCKEMGLKFGVDNAIMGPSSLNRCVFNKSGKWIDLIDHVHN